MDAQQLPLTFAEMTEADIPKVTDVMTRAFDDDSRRHLGRERGGPEGYDTGDFFRKWLLGYRESIGYLALMDGCIIGAAIVWVFPHGHNVLGTIFVDPEYQDRGIGTRFWRFLEATYSQTKDWRLETPIWATKNHHFYEKCGFARVGEQDDVYKYYKGTTP